MIKTLQLCALAALAPLPLVAETTYLSDPDYCGEPRFAAYEAGVMALFETGLETIEYGCDWDAPITIDFSQTSTQIRPGYCAEPGEYIYAQVFVIGMSESDPGRIRVWSSDVASGEPVIYTACD